MVVMQFKNIRLRFDYLIVFTCLTPALLFWARDLVVHLGAFGDLVDQFLFLAQREADDRQVFRLPGSDGLPVGRIMASRKHVLYID